jgi:hypothetical protein
VAFARIERANIDAALDWAWAHDAPLALEIAVHLGWVWVLAGDALAPQRLIDSLTAAVDRAPRELHAEGWLLLGWLHAAAGDLDSADNAVTRGIDQLAAVRDDDYSRSRTDFYRAYVRSQQGEFDESMHLLERSRTVFSQLGRPWDEAANWVLTAHVALATGDQPAAEHACLEAARLLEDVADPWLLTHTEAMLGALAQA